MIKKKLMVKFSRNAQNNRRRFEFGVCKKGIQKKTFLTSAGSEAFHVFNSSQLTQTDNEIVLLYKKMRNSGEMKQVSDVLPEYKTDFVTDHIFQF